MNPAAGRTRTGREGRSRRRARRIADGWSRSRRCGSTNPCPCAGGPPLRRPASGSGRAAGREHVAWSGTPADGEGHRRAGTPDPGIHTAPVPALAVRGPRRRGPAPSGTTPACGQPVAAPVKGAASRTSLCRHVHGALRIRRPRASSGRDCRTGGQRRRETERLQAATVRSRAVDYLPGISDAVAGRVDTRASRRTTATLSRFRHRPAHRRCPRSEAAVGSACPGVGRCPMRPVVARDVRSVDRGPSAAAWPMRPVHRERAGWDRMECRHERFDRLRHRGLRAVAGGGVDQRPEAA